MPRFVLFKHCNCCETSPKALIVAFSTSMILKPEQTSHFNQAWKSNLLKLGKLTVGSTVFPSETYFKEAQFQS